MIRIQYNGSNSPGAYQNALTVGKRYRVTGYARGDGSANPAFNDTGTPIKAGTTSTLWQYFDLNLLLHQHN